MSWASEHLALVIILAAIIVALVIIGIIFFMRKRSNNGYERLEMGFQDYLATQSPADQKKTELEHAEMNCRFFLRSVTAYEFIRTLPEIGNRPGKHYFLIRSKNEKRENRDQVLAMFPRDEACCFPFTEGTRRIVTGILSKIQHPFVFPTTYSDIDINNNLVFVIQPFRSQGSLKDQIFQTDPQYNFSRKYKVPGKPLNERTIAQFGRQILEGLLYFDKIGYPYGQLCPSNVIIDGGVCKLASYESSLFGLSTTLTEEVLAPILRNHRKANKNRRLLNVLQFGHVIFEMALGYPLETEAVPRFQSYSCPKKVSDVMDFIFGKQAIPNRPQTDDPESPDACPFPTIQELIRHPFFADAVSKIKLSDLTYNSAPFDPDMEELLAGIKNKKKMASTDTTKSKKKSKRTSTLLSRSDSTTTVTSQPSKSSTIVTTPSTSSPPPPPTTSTTSTAPPPPRPVASPASSAPPPPPPAPSAAPPPSSSGRSGLLNSITGFSGGLKKVKTNDRSTPTF